VVRANNPHGQKKPLGLTYGLSVIPSSGRSWQEEVLYQESRLGGKLTFLKRFVAQWRGETVVNPDVTWAIADGRKIVVTFKASASQTPYTTWAQIAAGNEDTWIDAQAAAVAVLDQNKIQLSYHHEPDTTANQVFGTAADFIAAFRHVQARFNLAGVTAAWVYTVTGLTVSRCESFYPGDGFVDIIAVNEPYNFSPVKPDGTTGGTWTDPTTLSAQARTWANSKSKPVQIGEWGAQEDPNDPLRKAAWITQAGAYLKAWTNLRQAIYFSGIVGNINWRLDSSYPALSAFAALIGGDPPPPQVQTYRLTVTNSGCAGARITSTPAGIDCPSGSTVTHDYPIATVVILTGTPGATCTGPTWSGDGSGTTTRTVTMGADKSITGAFAPIPPPPSTFRLTVNVAGGCTDAQVSSSPAGISALSGQTDTADYNSGTVVTLTGTPGTSCGAVVWSGDGSGTTTRMVTMTADKSVTGTFAAPPPPPTTFRLTVTVGGCAGSRVDSSPAGLSVLSGSSGFADYNSGTVVTLTPTLGATCTGPTWSGDGSGTTTRTVTMSANRAVTATFTTPPPPTGIPIHAADNPISIINAHVAGTTYVFDANATWTGLGQLPVKAGDIITGATTSVLVAGSTTSYLFDGSAGPNNVQISNISVQGAVIANIRTGTGWKVTNVDTSLSEIGIKPLKNGWVVGGRAHHNRRYGVDSSNAVDSVVDGMEIDNNNTAHYPAGDDAGGTKFNGAVNQEVAYCDVHNNYGNGLWFDSSDTGGRIHHNEVHDNLSTYGGGEGIRVEICRQAEVDHNNVYNNQKAGIHIVNSFECNTHDNIVSVPPSAVWGIGTLSDNRAGTYRWGGTYRSDDNVYTNNTVTLSSSSQFNGTQLVLGGGTMTGNIFTNNHYIVPAGCSSARWKWINTNYNFTGWQALGPGHDNGGTCSAT
jgi:hypothetical protein